jgi:hypothetical protein
MCSTCAHDKSSSRDVVVRVIAEVRSTSAYTMHYTIVITQNSTCGDNGVDVGPLFYHLLALLPQHVPVCAHTRTKVITSERHTCSVHMLQNDKDQNGTKSCGTPVVPGLLSNSTQAAAAAPVNTPPTCACARSARRRRGGSPRSPARPPTALSDPAQSMYEYAAVPVKKTPCDTEDRLGVIIVSTQVESLLYRPAPPH